MLPIFQKKFVQELRDFSAVSRGRVSEYRSKRPRESPHLKRHWKAVPALL